MSLTPEDIAALGLDGMTAEKSKTIEIGLRLVACRHWRWMPGMLAVAHREQPLEPVVERMNRAARPPAYPGSVPDLDDPATVGCLLALVREAWGDDGINVALIALPGQPRSCAMWVVREGYPDTFHGDFRELTKKAFETEAGALVALLEAAP